MQFQFDDSGKLWSFLSYTDRMGRTYIQAYRNQWDPIKKRAHYAKRMAVGRLQDDGSIVLSKGFLDLYPDLKNEHIFWGSNSLLSAAEYEALVPEGTAPRTDISWSEDTIRYGLTWCAWQYALVNGVLDDLAKVFGEEKARTLLALAIYKLDGGIAMMNFEDWLPQVYLPQVAPIDGRRLSEFLSKIDPKDVTDYFKHRHQRAIDKAIEENAPALTLSFDSTSISTYSKTIEDAAYGYAKQDEELQQVNLITVCDHRTGEILYMASEEGSVNDKASFSYILNAMLAAGFKLEDNILITDRGYQSMYNTQTELNLELKFVQGLALIEDTLKRNFTKKMTQLNDPVAFKDPTLQVAAQTCKEPWSWHSDSGTITSTVYVHLYKNQARAVTESEWLLARVEEVLKAKNKGARVEPDTWRAYGRYLRERKQGQKSKWVKDMKALADATRFMGCFAIRTNAIEDPFEALRLYRQREIIEQGFNQLKNEVEGRRMHSTETTYRGKLFVYALAESLRLTMLVKAKNVSRENPSLRIPEDSMRKVFLQLNALTAIKHRTTNAYVTRTVPIE